MPLKVPSKYEREQELENDISQTEPIYSGPGQRCSVLHYPECVPRNTLRDHRMFIHFAKNQEADDGMSQEMAVT